MVYTCVWVCTVGLRLVYVVLVSDFPETVAIVLLISVRKIVDWYATICKKHLYFGHIISVSSPLRTDTRSYTISLRNNFPCEKLFI